FGRGGSGIVNWWKYVVPGPRAKFASQRPLVGGGTRLLRRVIAFGFCATRRRSLHLVSEPGVSIYAPASPGGEFPREAVEFASADRCSQAAHQLQVVVQVVDRREPRAEDLVDFLQVVQ